MGRQLPCRAQCGEVLQRADREHRLPPRRVGGATALRRRFVNKYRRFAILPVAMLVLAACQGGPARAASTRDGRCQRAGGETVCVGEATTYLVWLDGTFAARRSGRDRRSLPTASGDHLADVMRPESWRLDRRELRSRSRSASRTAHEGFDIDVATEIAARLGVEVEFSDPRRGTSVMAGSWADRWDMSVGSMTITETAKECSTSPSRTTSRRRRWRRRARDPGITEPRRTFRASCAAGADRRSTATDRCATAVE